MKLPNAWFLWFLPFAAAYSINNVLCPDACQCDNEITNCKNNGLKELPIDIDINVVNLDLSYNEFEVFPIAINDYSQLQSLNLSHNRIATLKYSDMPALEKLLSLDFTYNLFRDWKDIHSGAFKVTKKLKFLDFSNNPLRSITEYSNHLFMESLTILRLTNCSMKTISVNVFNRLSNLRELYLSDNPITSIDGLFQLENIRLIDMSGCHLNYIGENVFSVLPNLEILTLKHNIHLKQFTCNSQYLIYLDLSGSMLERMPNGTLSKLSRMNLSGNYLKTIPANALTSPSLQILNLSNNSITSISEQAFQGLNEVITIDLSFNKLTKLPKNLLNNVSSLYSLNLSHNYINTLDTIISKSLKRLTASYCEIYELNRDSLNGMPNLITLELSRNYLTNLPDNLNAQRLFHLDVSYCRIKSLNNKTFNGMFYLREINLASNGLVTINPSFFPRALDVNLMDNPWRCDCTQLKRMFEWMSTYDESQLRKLICDSPESVGGKTWEEACIKEWYPNQKKDTMWYYSVCVVVLMVVALFGVVVLKKVKARKEKRLRQELEARRAEEEEALRRMQERQREMREEEDRNAPDPRDLQRPPSYHEALLLPRLDASSLGGSLASFGSRPSLRGSSTDIAKKNRIRRKRRRRKSEEERRASRITIDESDSSDATQSQDNLSTRRKPNQLPLESDF